jgi:hypothetical protein
VFRYENMRNATLKELRDKLHGVARCARGPMALRARLQPQRAPRAQPPPALRRPRRARRPATTSSLRACSVYVSLGVHSRA